MHSRVHLALRLVLLTVGALTGALAAWGVPAPPSFTVENMPRIAWKHVWRSRRIVQAFSAQHLFAAWLGQDDSMLVAAGTRRRFGRLDKPGGEPASLPSVPEGARVVDWSGGGVQRHLVYMLDEGGSERYRLYRYDVDSASSEALTDEAARLAPGGLDPSGRRFAWSSNARNGRDMDIYVSDVTAPESRRRVLEGGGDLWPAAWTRDGRLLVSRLTGMRTQTFALLDPGNGSTQPLLEHRPDLRLNDAVTSRTANILYLATDLGDEWVGVHAFDPVTLETSALTSQLSWDVVDLEALADGRTLAALVNEDAVYRLYLLDLPTGRLTRVAAPLDGFPIGIHAHPTERRVALDVVDRAGVAGVWTYDVDTGRFEPWILSGLATDRPAPRVIRYPTVDFDDGQRRQISAVVLDPPERYPGDRQPVLIDIHGGPTSQSLAYVTPRDAGSGPSPVIIRPNVRGSSGYGRSFEALDDGRRREDAVRDIGALLDWVAAQPDLDPERVAVMGASYGGFMSLAALTHYSARLRCGVDLFGISNFPTFLEESERGHFPDAQRGEYGDGRDPGTLAFLTSVSPQTHAERITVPLLIYQGANDVRVKPAQSRQMVDRIRAVGGEVTYIEVPNEGHGLDRPLTQFYVGVASLQFVTSCLGV